MPPVMQRCQVAGLSLTTLMPRRYTWVPFQSAASAVALLGSSVISNGANAAALLVRGLQSAPSAAVLTK